MCTSMCCWLVNLDENNIVWNPKRRRTLRVYTVYCTIYVMNLLALLNKRIGWFIFWFLYHGSHQHCSEKTPFWFDMFNFWAPTLSIQLWERRLGLFFLLLAKGIKRTELQFGRHSKVSGFKNAWINRTTIKQVLQSNEKTNAEMDNQHEVEAKICCWFEAYAIIAQK